jgi:hypothetical protein
MNEESDYYPRLFLYWGARDEGAAACARRLQKMLTDLVPIHPIFAKPWHQGGQELLVRLFSAPPDYADVLRLVEAGVAMLDVPHVPRPAWGYHVHIYCGRTGSGTASLIAHVGSTTHSRRFVNTLDLALWPRDDPGDATVRSYESLRTILNVAASAWQPDWGSVFCLAYWRLTKQRLQRWPDLRSGWMTYLSAAFTRRITPPPEAIVELAPGGAVLLATRESFDMDNPAHILAADAIQDALEPLKH